MKPLSKWSHTGKGRVNVERLCAYYLDSQLLIYNRRVQALKEDGRRRKLVWKERERGGKRREEKGKRTRYSVAKDAGEM
jgi:hypothetical protein